jgi:glycosyltransferase involved in cell wall biosynthesis
MKADSLVSAIIPTYNRAHAVCEAVESVLNQTYSKIEVVVVDDGSTDDTQAQLKKYGNRIRVITQNNAGPAVARNHGIAASNGELIAFLDSDDLWLPHKIDRQVALLHKAGVSIPCCLCNITMRWTDMERTSFETAYLAPSLEEGIWVNVDEVLATRFLLFNQGVAIRRNVLEKIGGFDENLWLLEDHELALRLSLEGPWAFLREPLVIWRESTSGNSLSQKAQKEESRWRERMVQILEKHLATVTEGRQHSTLRRNVHRELKRNRRCLRAAQIGELGSCGAAVAKSIRKIEQYRRAVFIRSPWFPKMKVESSDY